MSTAPLLAVQHLDVSVPGRTLVRGLDLVVNAGETLAILGRNGSGKTSLLHTLAGLREASRGDINLCGKTYASHGKEGSRAAARLRGILTQAHPELDGFPANLLQTALIGRHPHLSRWAWEGAAEERIARDALTAVGLAGMERREVQTLSGGERQRLAIATLLTQQPQLYLLDEPLAHLDLNHQIAMLELLTQNAAKFKTAIVVVLHDVNLALRYCQRSLLLFEDGNWQEGASEQVLTMANLGKLYSHPLRELRDGDSRYFIVA